MERLAILPFDQPTSALHAARTTTAAVVSVLVARALKMPEPYWATVTTIVVMQSTLGAAWKVSATRFAGTAVGAVSGGLLATYFGANLWVFAIAIFGTGLLCTVLHLDRTAYRFAGITLAIIMLVARDRAAWIIAVHRFAEVSLGIAVALVLTAVWPERQPAVRGQSVSPVGPLPQRP
jgi:uncharacterized membrane protein YccC